ncbi:zinc-binding alcohol dehydrogenase family protein [Streptomyces qinglanensis]|uniref:Zinc-type alcohol dehydrogenase-like protein n=1 Tax=Streptomyces qinglanensis TaxID=943816 RepID=A0A1H9WFN1_9ACTN|nr:zinc-binding alcohol dehydrogenase family protein [Streptomyces qinglanensis]SES32644.1 zinc-binding alcohol dehydrogenase family protein [Streptomyces qinglanensis]
MLTPPRTTTAVAAPAAGEVDAPASFAVLDVPLDPMGPHDLLVEVRAVSVNPVDVKVRASFPAQAAPKVLGFDAAGVVVATGSEVTFFAPGDEVYYAGSIARTGSNAEHHLVDERIVGPKPASLDFVQAAAAPLTAITAWETLFERMGLTAKSAGTLLVVGGAGGVGSMVTQLARQLTGTTVIATASRDESQAWARRMGAHHVVDHRRLREEVAEVAPGGVDHIFSPFSAGNVQTYADIMNVHGQVVAVDEPEGLDTLPLKARSQTWHWELMFSRPLHDPTSTAQRDLLVRVAALFDAGVLESTLTRTLGPLTADTLREAHRLLESSRTIGKVAMPVTHAPSSGAYTA